MLLFTEVQCPAYKAFPTGVEGGSTDPCKPADSFHLSSTTDPSCSLQCQDGYEVKGGTGKTTLQCDKAGTRSGELTCTGKGGCLTYIGYVLGTTHAHTHTYTRAHTHTPVHLDVDECENNAGGCHSERTCKNTEGSFECGDCSAGYDNDGAKGCKGLNWRVCVGVCPHVG